MAAEKYVERFGIVAEVVPVQGKGWSVRITGSAIENLTVLVIHSNPQTFQAPPDIQIEAGKVDKTIPLPISGGDGWNLVILPA